MGYVVAQLLKARLGVSPQIGLVGHESNHEALLRGEIDLYIEYTGTALRRMLGLESAPPARTYEIVRDVARERWPVEWLSPFGFNNTYALLIRRADADRLGVRTCTDLVPHAPSLTLGAWDAVIDGDRGLRFAPGGINGLRQAYGVTFRDHRRLPAGYSQAHRALAAGEVDVIVDFPVNPIVHQHDLVDLHDDRGFFSAYHAAPVVRRDFLDGHPGARAVIETLAGRVDNRTMARLNFEVDIRGRNSADVASAWLREAGLLESRAVEDRISAPPGRSV